MNKELKKATTSKKLNKMLKVITKMEKGLNKDKTLNTDLTHNQLFMLRRQIYRINGCLKGIIEEIKTKNKK